MSDDIARQIEFAIHEGRLVPGQALPSERDLAGTFNVSRPIIREALRALEIRGFVTIQQGCCTLIKDPGTDILNQPVSAWLEENMQALNDFYEARLAIEPACAELASQRAADRQLRSLLANLEESERIAQSGENLATLVGLDIDFHSEIARMSANPYLVKLLNALIVPETDVRKIVLRLPDHIPATLQGHRRIYAAIQARDPKGARQAMIAALHQPFAVIEKYMRAAGDGGETGRQTK
ncbi:MAG: FadR/GntR family transcriptional regulator [Anaerolineaceae bacterium]|nr:FadR/GntR family transcriptional regulator [Anaerolineaceae bacterium]